MQNENHHDKVVLITGSVGRASAERFLEDGYRVVMADINEVLLDETLGTLEKKHPGSKETSVVCDVTKTADCRKAVEKTIEAFGRLDVLINSAGVIKKGPVEEVPEVYFKETLADFPQGDAARFIYPEDVANLLAFLASDRAEAMTGAPVHLDFGTTAGN